MNARQQLRRRRKRVLWTLKQAEKYLHIQEAERHVIVECQECDYTRYYSMYEKEKRGELKRCPQGGGVNVEIY